MKIEFVLAIGGKTAVNIGLILFIFMLLLFAEHICPRSKTDIMQAAVNINNIIVQKNINDNLRICCHHGSSIYFNSSSCVKASE